MGWVDVDDSGVITLDYGQAGRDIKSAPSNAANAVTQPIKDVGSAVAKPFNDFADKGNREGYGEAVWQDVVQPIAGTSTSRGAIVGGAGALAADMIDPTPGINPMNIMGGSLAGAAIGTAAPYAFDAVQALSSPNSLLRGETYSKALEGAGIASGITGEVDQGIQDMVQPGFGEDFTERGLNIAKNVAEGAGNAYQGALAGTNQLGSDVAGFFGFDDTAEMYQVLADNRRNAMGKNSAVGAMAEETSYDAGMGGALGKGAEVLGAAGKGIGRWAGSNVIQRGQNKLADLMGTVRDTVKPGVNKGKIAGQVVADTLKNQSMFPGVQALADLAGTFSPKSKNFIEKNWDSVAAYVFGGEKASLRAYEKMYAEGRKLGYSGDEVNDILDFMKKNPKKLEPLKRALSSGTNTGAAKLFGVGTGILADVEDNPRTLPQSMKGIGL